MEEVNQIELSLSTAVVDDTSSPAAVHASDLSLRSTSTDHSMRVLDEPVKEEKNAEPPPISLLKLYSEAHGLEFILLIIGSFCAIICGAAFPAFNILFGQMLDNINKSPSSFDTAVKNTAISLTVVGAISFVLGIVQVYTFTAVGERVTQRIRERYVNAILRQEIGWFDQVHAVELAPRVSDLCGKIQDGLGRKCSEVFQFSTQVIASFIVGFYFCWQLALVLLAAIPGIALAGMFMISAVTAAQNGALEQYGKAGGLATEVLSSFKTVSALNAQPTMLLRYQKYVIDAMNIGILKGLKVGFGNGALYGCAFAVFYLFI